MKPSIIVFILVIVKLLGCEGNPLKSQEQTIDGDLVLKIQIYYDKHFLGLHEQSLLQSKLKLEEIFGQLQILLKHKSLGAKINLHLVKDPIYVPGRIFVSDLPCLERSASQISNLDSWTDHHTFFGFNPGTEIYGIGYQGSICHSNPKLRSSIVLWRESADLTALVWAHEIGHALNMTHDFFLDRSPKHDNSGRRCSNGKGIMDYLSKSSASKTRLDIKEFYWSTCSVDDLGRTYKQHVREKGFFCLERTPNKEKMIKNEKITDCLDQFELCFKWTSHGLSCKGHPLKNKYCPRSCHIC